MAVGIGLAQFAVYGKKALLEEVVVVLASLLSLLKIWNADWQELKNTCTFPLLQQAPINSFNECRSSSVPRLAPQSVSSIYWDDHHSIPCLPSWEYTHFFTFFVVYWDSSVSKYLKAVWPNLDFHKFALLPFSCCSFVNYQN